MEGVAKAYLDGQRQRTFFLLMASLMTALGAVLAMGFGSSDDLSMRTTLGILFGFQSPEGLQREILINLRLPRVLIALAGGAALAMAGTMMQGVLGNPLVSPLTLGVASGAGLGAALAIVLDVAIFGAPELAILGNAFIFAMLVVAIIIKLGDMSNVTSESYILVGIAITFIAGAVVQTMQYFATDAQISQLTHWSFGSLSRPDLQQASLIGLFVLALLPSGLRAAWDLNTLAVGGDDFAASTGVDPRSTRRSILILSATLTAVVIAFTGIIGFLGLVAPHIARILVGNDYRVLIPTSAVMGAAVLLVADTIGRTLFAPVVLPVGVMLSVLGGPFFLYLLLMRRQSA
ncbi:MAG TPA: iron ABC transporter permease [Candidatus Poseidoniales archaeon]|nr:MAG TPA: iron ABC transporter permease [Candidatus Poseidoniales archaeon]